jgi:hypothetical protein
MGKKDFEAFLEKQDAIKKKEKQIDWNKRKQKWLDYIEQFYDLVQGWLIEYQDKGQAFVDFMPLLLNEEHIGRYETKSLHLSFGHQEVVFSPIGTQLIGSLGRIDMVGHAGKVKFFLVDKETSRSKKPVSIFMDKPQSPINWTWKIATPPPSIQFLELNEESFFEALMEVING